MKRQLTVAFGLAVLATPAFATKARLEALGEDNYGSYYINDNRNMFLNPARINDHKDVVNYEFGKSGTGSSVYDSANSPKAEGGFTKSHGNMVYGLQFGNTTPNVSLVRGAAVASATSAPLAERQPWDLFVGGDAGVKWGANVTYENYDSGRNDSTSRVASNSLRTRLGVVMGDLDLFTHISLSNSAKDFAGQSAKGNVGYLLGAAYTLNNYRLFAEFRQIGAKYAGAVTTGGSKQDLDYNQIRIGAARQERLNDKATLFAKLMVTRQAVRDDGGYLGLNPGGLLGQGNGWNTAGTSVDGGKATVYQLPLVLGTEYNATSWLDLRASISQNIWSKVDTDARGANGGKSSGNIANTAVRAGATLKFGDFAIDGLVSTTASGDASAGTTTATTNDGSTNQGNGALRTDALMTRVSMIYRF